MDDLGCRSPVLWQVVPRDDHPLNQGVNLGWAYGRSGGASGRQSSAVISSPRSLTSPSFTFATSKSV